MKARGATYGDLTNGDRVRIEGYTFTVADLRIVSASMPVGEYGPGIPVVRFRGIADPASTIAGTGYDGGIYGGILARPAAIVEAGS